MNTLRPTSVDDDRFREIARVGQRFDGPIETTRARLGGVSLRAAVSDEAFLGVSWNEFLNELDDVDSPHNVQDI